MGTPRSPIGQRVRAARERQRRTQSAVAGLCGITVDYLSQIERGLKVPSIEVLHALSRELGAPVSQLLGDKEDTSPTELTIAPAVAQALFGYGRPPAAEPVRPHVLRERVEDAWHIWQTASDRFTKAAGILPDLIRDVERARTAYRSPGDAGAHTEVLRCAADLYALLRSYCRRTGRTDLSLMVADRALRAAQEADDPVRIATAHWNLGHILLGDKQPEAAEQVARGGIEQLAKAPPSREVLAMKGALELVAVVGLARRRRWWEARDRLNAAAPLADKVGETNVGRTVFGPTNVQLHALSIEMEAGETVEALRVADDVDTSELPSMERQYTFALHVARCYDQRREDAAVLVHLIDLQHAAPEDLARTPEAVSMVRRLVERVRPTYRKQALALATRMGIR
ncbi:XRE family transcriptional regulator [Streptomyces sp. 8K308]|uniref:helix-turn-helix domain-containing protein n=1 Tax=Streptomyces sp. 8K308 TaxID=2530388 RepID=UPI00104BE721|nr:helix-turn-helix transcriptional regulator [Streptomyces sp. 8K308]TDC27697.1 XRE family transcriptional regulator [Streptomyces sp. 8K308]